MSTLKVANVHFDSAGTNRIEYRDDNVLRIHSSGTTVFDTIQLDLNRGNISNIYDLNMFDGNGSIYMGDAAGFCLGTLGSGLQVYLNGDGTVQFYMNGGYPLKLSKGTTEATGNLYLTGTGKLGYNVGSGGSVTQLTSKTTGVTLNKPNGSITMNNSTLGANTTTVFALTNSTITPTDIVVCVLTGGVVVGSYYQVWASTGASGACSIYLRNIHTASLSEAPVVQFAILKSATS